MNKIKQPPIPLPCRLCGVTSHSVIVQHGEGIGGFFITLMTDQERQERQKAADRKWHAANREKVAEKNRKWREANREKNAERVRKWRKANPKKVSEMHCKWREANAVRLAEQKRNYHAANCEKINKKRREYRAANLESVRSQARTQKRTQHANKKSDPIYQMARRVRGRMRMALKEKGFCKESKTAKTIGCSWKQFAKHIESQFSGGMSWDNRSEWHLDHILPLSCATTIEGLEKLSHYTNIRPLWAAENLRKSDNLVLMW